MIFQEYHFLQYTNTTMCKIACITGCSSGFGLALTETLVQDYIIYATARSPETATELHTLAKKHPDRILIRPLDVTKKDTISSVMSEIKSTHNRLDALINNAGYAIGGFFEDLSDTEIRDQFETNFFGLQDVTRQALPLIRQTPQSKIVMLSSIAGCVSTPGLSAYNASKFALEGFSESLYFELQHFDASVILIQPGVYNTQILNKNKQMAANSEHPNSPYTPLTKQLLARFDQMLGKSLSSPTDVATYIATTLKQANPKLRHLLGKQAKIRFYMSRYLPFKLYGRLLQKALFKGK